MAVPGVLNLAEGQLEEVTNLPQWERFPLQNHLRRLFDCPAVLVNDANAAAYAEYRLRNMASQSLALVTLGTGVGCGIVLLGTPWAGDFGAGESWGTSPSRGSLLPDVVHAELPATWKPTWEPPAW